MGLGTTRTGRGGRLIWAAGILLGACAGDAASTAHAQFFNLPTVRPHGEMRPQGELRPPADILEQAAPIQNLAPPAEGTAPPRVAPRGPALQSLPPAANPAPQQTQRQNAQAQLALAARYGSNLPQITGGLHWRVYPAKPDQAGAFRPLKEDKSASPMFSLPPGNYIVHVGFGLASATRTVNLRADGSREVFEIPAGGLRITGRVGDARIPPGQVWFDLFSGSQFEPGDRRPIVQSVAAGDVILVPEGSYHIVSHYGDGNSVVRSDIRVQTGKLIDAVVTHRAAIITLKLVSQYGGEARANTQWSVLTPGGDIVKESIGAFPRVILGEGEYRAVARSDDREKPYERTFKVVTGVDTDVEVLAR
ncbi:MAG: hypothetical protein GEU95_09870 [Rhizobiales bacterium]|nr:hypothetical protein [Hyphomicrobiales bacterium]